MLNTEQLNIALTCVCSEIDAELAMEHRGMNLGDNIARLFSLREALKAEIKATVPKE